MNVSPLDLRQQRFSTALRGFDKVEVTSLLMAVADDYEQALRDSDRLRQEVAKLEGIIGGYREQEKSLQSTLVTAQKLADDIRRSAEDEARRIVREAQGRSELLLEKTQARVEDVQREIAGTSRPASKPPFTPSATRWSSSASRMPGTGRTRFASTGQDIRIRNSRQADRVTDRAYARTIAALSWSPSGKPGGASRSRRRSTN